MWKQYSSVNINFEKPCSSSLYSTGKQNIGTEMERFYWNRIFAAELFLIFRASCLSPPPPHLGHDGNHWAILWMKSKTFKATYIRSAYLLRGEECYLSQIMRAMGLNSLSHQQVIMHCEWWRCTADGNFTGEGRIQLPRSSMPSRYDGPDYWRVALRCPLQHKQTIKHCGGDIVGYPVLYRLPVDLDTRK
jgi:hypothetical protein